ncbi:MAG: ABC transporter permease, partial [Casimicrobiaceae bacterium]
MSSAANPGAVVSPFRLFLTEFGENRLAVIALVLLGMIILLAVVAPLITPQNPYDLATLVLTDARRPP